MTPRQLELFLEAADDLSFARTADRLGISQPAVSKQIGALERSMGAKLFERVPGRAVRLSPAGVAALENARLVLSTTGKLRGLRANPAPALLRICTRNFMLEQFIKPHHAKIAAALRPLALDFTVCDGMSGMMAEVRTRNADVALYRGPVLDPPGLCAKAVSAAPCSIYAAKGIAADVIEGRLGLNDAPWLLPQPHMPLHRWVIATLSEAGIRPTSPSFGSPFAEQLKWQVARGDGVGLLYDTDMADLVAEGRVFKLMDDVGDASVVTISRPGFSADVIARLERVLIQIFARSPRP